MKHLALSCLLAGALLLPLPFDRHEAGAAITSQELLPALEKLLSEHPEVLLDFLQEHGQAVLDAAQKGSNQRRLQAMEKQWAKDAKEHKTFAVEGRPTMGNPAAKVRIVAFSDFTCHYCQRAEKLLAELLKEFSGKVSFVFKNMPLEPKGLSGQAALYFIGIADQSEELAWKFYENLFQNRDKLLVEGEAYLRNVAQQLGVDMKAMDKKRRSKAAAAILDEDLKDADKLKVEGTPYFLVNDLVIRGSTTKEIFRRAIELELAK